MGPYSHYYLAAKLEPFLDPDQPGEYYWGSIIPDIRYLARMKRSQTHLSRERLKELLVEFPHLRSFLLGYQAHCLMDEVDISPVVEAVFPLNLARRALHKGLSKQQMTMLVEMYYLQSTAPAKALSGSHNELLGDLGITPEQTGEYFRGMQEYFAAHSFEGAVSAYQKIGMIENGRLEKYTKAYQAMKQKKGITAVFLFCVRRANLDRKVVDYVRQSIRSGG